MLVSISGKNIEIGDSLRQCINDTSLKISQIANNIAMNANFTIEKIRSEYKLKIVVYTNDHSKIVIRATAISNDPYIAVAECAKKVIKQFTKHKDRIEHHHRSHHHERMSVEAKKYVVYNENKFDEMIKLQSKDGVVKTYDFFIKSNIHDNDNYKDDHSNTNNSDYTIQAENTQILRANLHHAFFADENENFRNEPSKNNKQHNNEHKYNQNEQNTSSTIIAERDITLARLSLKDAIMRMELLDAPAYVFINKINSNICVIYYRRDGNISWIDTGKYVDDELQSET